MSPPTYTATEPARGIVSCEGEPDLSTQNGRQRYLMAELGISAVEAHHMLRAHELDLRDAAADKVAHAQAVEAGGFDDLAEVVRETFREWVARQRRLRASNPRRDGWRQR